MNYETLLEEALTNNVDVIETKFKGNAKGYYSNDVIALSTRIETTNEKKCVLAEELGHHHTTNGNILDKSIVSIKREKIARNWAYSKLIRILDLIDAFEHGIQGRHDLADYLEVTEEFLDNTITYYRNKYGTHYQIDNFIIIFEPSLSIIKLF